MMWKYPNKVNSQRSSNKQYIQEPDFRELLYELHKLLEFQSGSLFIVEDDAQSLREIASVGEGIDFISQVHFPMGSGLSAWVAQKSRLIYLPDIHRGSRHGLNPIRSYLSIPLEINNRVIGVLNLGHVVPDAFDEKNRKRIEPLLREITRKLYNRLYLNYMP